MISAVTSLPMLSYPDLNQEKLDYIAQEIPIALVYNGISHVVMMATPLELEEFAIGFSLSEGIVTSEKEIYSIDIVEKRKGVEVNIELSSRCFMQLKQQRRSMTGRTGCGICGTEQLDSVCKALTPLPFTHQLSLKQLPHILDDLNKKQLLKKQTGCTHAVGWINKASELEHICEDVGRHVALDKLLGKKSKEKWQSGAIITSSRASYEMVQKTVACGVEILLACSAPTVLAIETAQQYQLTLVGFCRGEQANIYTHSSRLL